MITNNWFTNFEKMGTTLSLIILSDNAITFKIWSQDFKFYTGISNRFNN